MSTQSQFLPTSTLPSAALLSLFPAAVVIRELRTPGIPADLLPAEAAHVANAVPKRVNEFAAGRVCARSALAVLGVENVALHAGADRQPVWPPGFSGSITHTTGLCAAAVATLDRVAAIGLDSEVVGAPSEDIWPTICRSEELEWIGTLPPSQRAAAVTLLFSAKEAIYKCQYPLVGEWLDFEDLHVDVAAWGSAQGAFTATPTRDIQFARYGLPILGRYAFHEQWVSAGVFVSAGAAPALSAGVASTP